MSPSVPAWLQAMRSEYKQAPIKLLEWLALAAVFLLAVVFWLSHDLARAFEVTGWAALLISAAQIWRQDRREWLWLIMIGWVIFMLAVNYTAMQKYPELGDEHLHFTRYYARLFLFLMAGWWLGGNPRRVFVFLLLAALGLHLDSLFNTGLAEWKRLFAGQRVDFGFWNPQHPAVLFSVMLIGLLCFWKRFFRISSKAFRPGAIALWFVLIALTLVNIIGAQTRQILAAFPVCLIAAAVWALYEAKKGRLAGSRIVLYSSSAGVIVLFLAVLLFSPLKGIQERFEKEQESIMKFMDGELDNLPMDGVGIRVLHFQFALKKFFEKPVTGWGGATKYALIEKSDWPKFIKKHYGHFHNGYLEMAVAYGIPGLLMLPLLLTVLAGRIMRAWRKHALPTDFMLFGILSLIFFAMVNLFESYPMYPTGYFFMCIVGGAMYTLTRPWALTDTAENVPSGSLTADA